MNRLSNSNLKKFLLPLTQINFYRRILPFLSNIFTLSFVEVNRPSSLKKFLLPLTQINSTRNGMERFSLPRKSPLARRSNRREEVWAEIKGGRGNFRREQTFQVWSGILKYVFLKINFYKNNFLNDKDNKYIYIIAILHLYYYHLMYLYFFLY